MEKPNSKGIIVCYVGTDTGYFQNIITRYRSTYEQKKWEFPIIAPKKGEGYESLFLKVLENYPKIIYLDFTCEKERTMALAENLSRDPNFHNVPIIGFVDKKEDTKQCLGVGVDFLYVKGGEFFDIVYSAMTVAFPNMVKPAKFAKAKTSQEVDLYDDFRIGYIAPTYIHVEGNFHLKEGNQVHFKNEIPLTNVPSQNFIVKNPAAHNLYYDFNYSYDLDFVFVDKPEEEISEDDIVDPKKLEGLDEADKEKMRIKLIKEHKEKQRQAIANFDDTMKRSQKKHKEWVTDRMSASFEKKTKLLIVDTAMRAYGQIDPDKSLASYPFSIRCQTAFSPDFEEINKQRPAIIAYQFLGEYLDEDEDVFNLAVQRKADIAAEKDYTSHEDNDVEKQVMEITEALAQREEEELNIVKRLVETIKGINDYNPILVLFRSYFKSSKALQESHQYPMIITHQGSLELDVCLNLAGIYEQRQTEKFEKLIKGKVEQLKSKDPKKYRNLTEEDFKEKKYFIKKSNSLSFGSLKMKVLLNSVSESEVLFRTDSELPMKTYRLDYPLQMSIHLVPIEKGKDYLKDKSEFVYKGLIHSISETDKKSLRQYVNEIIFEPVNEKRRQEQEKFQELNQKVHQDLEEEKAKTLELEEQQAKEDLGVIEQPLSGDDEEAKSSKESFSNPGKNAEPSEP